MFLIISNFVPERQRNLHYRSELFEGHSALQYIAFIPVQRNNTDLWNHLYYYRLSHEKVPAWKTYLAGYSNTFSLRRIFQCLHCLKNWWQGCPQPGPHETLQISINQQQSTRQTLTDKSRHPLLTAEYFSKLLLLSMEPKRRHVEVFQKLEKEKNMYIFAR